VRREREARLDRLAESVRKSIDLDTIHQWIGLPVRKGGSR
jgi:hypothetical protein